MIPLALGTVVVYNVSSLLLEPVACETKEERRRETERSGDKGKKKEGCVIRVARGIENGRKLADASQNKGKPPNETEIRISKRGIAAVQASCVEAFDVALTRKYLGRGNDVPGLSGHVISTPTRKRSLFQLESRFSPDEI